MTIEFKIIELLSSIGFEYNPIIISSESEKLTGHLKCVWSDTILETIGIANDSKEEESCDLFIDFHIHSPEEIIDDFTRRTCLGIDEIVRPKEGIARMVIDIDDRGTCENIRIVLERLANEADISTITNENGIEFLCRDF